MTHAPWLAAPIRRYVLAALFAGLTLLLVAVLTAGTPQKVETLHGADGSVWTCSPVGGPLQNPLHLP